MKRRAPLAAINITPLVDVLLILVAVLLLLAPHFVKPLPVSLPHTDLNGVPTTESTVQVAVQKSGKFWLNGHEVPVEAIRSVIRPGITTVQIGADSAAQYAQIVKLIENLRDTNPREIVLLTQ